MPQELQALESLFGAGKINFTIADVIALLSGQPVEIPIQPFNSEVAGKTLTISLQANAVQVQLH